MLLKIVFGGLPKAFQQVVEESAPNRSSTFKTVVEGTVLELHPLIREETYSIGREALINALIHSNAHNIEAEISYDWREFRLRIRDDGRGIDPEVLEKGGWDDHWGLQGMRERARKIGATLNLLEPPWVWHGGGTDGPGDHGLSGSSEKVFGLKAFFKGKTSIFAAVAMLIGL